MAQVRFDNVGALGQHRDELAYEVPVGAWTTGNNIRFRNGYLERFLGHTAVFDPPTVAPYGVFGTYANAVRYVVYCGLSAVYAVTGSTHTDITGTAPTGAAGDIWTGGTVPGGILVVNNGKDVPMFWNGNTATNLATLTDWTSTTVCKSIRPFKNFLVAVNINKNGTKYERMVKWSASADVGSLPASWDHTDTTKDAGEVDVDVSAPLIDACAYGDNLFIFSERETVVAQYIGPPYIFRFETISRTNGILAQRCATQVPGGVFTVSRNDIVLNNGSDSPPSLIDGRMKMFFFADLSSTYFARTFVVRNQTAQEVWVCYPSTASTGACDRALVWNYAQNTWTVRDLPNVHAGAETIIAEASATTWATVSGTWTTVTGTWASYDVSPTSVERVILASGTNTKLYAVDVGADFGGTDITARIERTGLAFDAPDRMKLVRSVRPRVDADAGTVLSVYVGRSFDPEGDVTWAGPYTYTVGTDLKVDCLVSGLYIGVRFESTADAAWRLRSYSLDVEMMGNY